MANSFALKRTAYAVVFSIASLASPFTTSAQARTDERAALLEADRQLGNNQAPDAISAFTAQFAENVSFISLGQIFQGVPAAREALSRNPDNARSTVKWAPIQGEVSADGKTGYTIGYMTLKTAEGKETPGKYVSFWVKENGAWRVLVYKRAGRGPGGHNTEEAAPTKPAMKAANYSAADSTKFAQELDAAERNFSREAGVIGVGPAFEKNAADDAHNVGAPTDAQFLRGPAAIAAGVGAGSGPPGGIAWSPDKVHVAKSGDLGVTFGYIDIKGPDGSTPRRVSYLTIWKRNGPQDKWKFVAE